MCASRHIRISGAVVPVILLALSGCVSPSKPRLGSAAKAEALSHFSLGLMAETEGDSAAAFEHFKTAVRLDPSEEKIYAPAVALALKLEKPDEAIHLAGQMTKQHPDTAEPVLLLAKVYALSNRPEQAEILFKKAAAGFPEHPQAPLFLARSYLAKEQPDEAEKTLRSAAAVQNENAELFSLLGILCIDRAGREKNPEQAKTAVREGIGFLQKSLGLRPENPAGWQQIGLAFSATQQPEDALDAFRQAHRYAPSDPNSARFLFDLLILTGRHEEALDLYDQLAADTGTPPESWLQYLAEKIPEQDQMRLTEHLEKQIANQSSAPVFYYAQLGALYIGTGKLQEAETVLRQALGHYPDDHRLRTVLGYLHLKQERYEEAYTDLNFVRTEAPASEWSANPFFLFNFMISAQKSGHLAEAAETLASTYSGSPVILNQYMHSLLTGQTPVSTENAIELLNIFHTLTPKAAEALYYLMVLQAEQKQYAKAIETARQFETVAKETGNTNLLNGTFYYQYASLYERTGELESAETLFRRVIDIGGDTAAAAQNYIAYMWAERGEKLNEGLELINKALASFPENGAFHDTLGWIYYMQGRYSKALCALQKALSLVKNDPTVWEHLGDTYMKLGDRTAATEHWKKALELDPESQKLIKRLNENGVSEEKHPVPADSPAEMTPRP